jgi:calcium-dependent protein kinase
VAEAFDRLDSDESGYISTRDLRDFLGKEVPMERIDEMINEADVDHDGQSK